MDKHLSESLTHSDGTCKGVKFSREIEAHDSQIILDFNDQEKKLNVHLGFLQLLHDYHVKFCLPANNLGEDISCDPLQSLNVQLLEASPCENGIGHDLLFLFRAQKEKLMAEKLTLESSPDSGNFVKLIFHARVLGKGKGTPALKDGVRCVAISQDDESSASDWKGF